MTNFAQFLLAICCRIILAVSAGGIRP